jgi:hypothetical protein
VCLQSLALILAHGVKDARKTILVTGEIEDELGVVLEGDGNIVVPKGTLSAGRST